MIRLATVALLCVTCHGAEPALSQSNGLDTAAFLEAVRLKESGSGAVQDGAAGERGPWQLRRSVWVMQMPGIDYAQARQEAPARACALKHIAWLAAGLRRAGADVNAFNLALAWNAGLTATTRGRAPVRAYQYARDVVALYDGEIGKKTDPKPAEMTRRWSARKTCPLSGFIQTAILSNAAATGSNQSPRGDSRIGAHRLDRKVSSDDVILMTAKLTVPQFSL